MLAAGRIMLALSLVLALACARREVGTESVAPSGSASAPIAEREGMDFFELIAARHSVRAFQKRDVSDATLKRIIAAATRAPSAGNQQAYEIVAVRTPDRKQELARAALDQAFIAEAPLVLVFLGNPARNRERYGERGARLYCLQDATIAAAYAGLAVQALGLGAVWVGAFDDTAVRRAVAAGPELVPSSLLVIGHPAEVPAASSRRPPEELMHTETLPR